MCLSKLQQPSGASGRGAPRVLLSNHKDPVTVPLGDTKFRVGMLDWMLRLYQHRGVTSKSVIQELDGEEYVCYLIDEWSKIEHVAHWLELVLDSEDTVCRID